MKPVGENSLIYLVTAILGGLIVLRNITGIINRIKSILEQVSEYIRLRNQRQKQELLEREMRQAVWFYYLQRGIAEEKLIAMQSIVAKKRKTQGRGK